MQVKRKMKQKKAEGNFFVLFFFSNFVPNLRIRLKQTMKCNITAPTAAAFLTLRRVRALGGGNI